MAFELKSPAFAEGERIPERHARDGENLSPPLEWMDPPAATRSFVILMEDPDATVGTLRHWGLYHIGRGRTLLPEAVRTDEGAGLEGLGACVNDFGSLRYEGPQPPEGDAPHRYIFYVAALDTERLDGRPGMTVAEMWRAAEPHVLAVAHLTGSYGR